MKSMRVLTCACALALVTAVGCSNAAAPEASTSETAESAPVSAVETSVTSTEDSTAASSAATSTEGSADAAAATSANAATTLTASAADSEGYQVFEGTVHVVKAEELIKLQGGDIDPAITNGQNGTFAVVAFDNPVDVTGEYADGSGQTTRSSKMIGVAELSPEYDIDKGDLESWRSIDGQKVKIGAKAEDIWFPSDVRLPLNEPATSAAILIQNA